MESKIIAQGAEAKIILSDNFIIKDRIKKSYRIPELDKKIRKKRTKAESKLLKKASEIINAPSPFFTPTPEFHKIKMPFVKGKKLSEKLDNFTLKKQRQICKCIGESIAKLHDENIIHGDLTTSNMILVSSSKKINKSYINKKPNQKDISSTDSLQRSLTKSASKQSVANKSKPIIYFIDFGLGYFNGKFEDKAVDLHLLKQALEAKHFKHWKILWKSIELGYKKSNSSKAVLEKLKAVEKRGRYKK